ncbi:fimbrial protein [Photorhabdus stackebrandtii]|uniref:Pilin n=1 Tax=Photorhabdus stackebrandtii TaxID=1123042 RepID=A0A7X5QJH9_9GAMM|nr:fimbrial protein [Photorhabdus stackebrandtii]NHB95411.1 pilin [Photorhabdus stackebrandtii]
MTLLSHPIGSKMLPSLLTLSVLTGLTLSFMAMAINQEHGRVNMQGSIIDTPCTIALGNQDQTIDISSILVGQIIRSGHGPVRLLSIQLINCLLTPVLLNRLSRSHFRVTFDGAAARDGLFSVNGVASGMGLQISDSTGALVVPGKPMPVEDLQIGPMRLDYTLRLVVDHQVLRARVFRTMIRFKLDYF